MKKELFDRLKDIIGKYPVASQEDIAKAEDSIIVVSRVSDFKLESNDDWDMNENKSFPREGVVCFECQEPVVMSNGMFEAYQKNTKGLKVICGRCVFDYAKKNK